MLAVTQGDLSQHLTERLTEWKRQQAAVLLNGVFICERFLSAVLVVIVAIVATGR